MGLTVIVHGTHIWWLNNGNVFFSCAGVQLEREEKDFANFSLAG